MIDPKKIDFKQLPKKFCDGAISTYGKEIFSFALTSGNTLDCFAMTPRTMKSFAVLMNKQLTSYEKQFGEIDMTPPKIQSPIQASDLRKPE